MGIYVCTYVCIYIYIERERDALGARSGHGGQLPWPLPTRQPPYAGAHTHTTHHTPHTTHHTPHTTHHTPHTTHHTHTYTHTHTHTYTHALTHTHTHTHSGATTSAITNSLTSSCQCTLHPAPYALHPTLQTPNPKPWIPNPRPHTPHRLAKVDVVKIHHDPRPPNPSHRRVVRRLERGFSDFDFRVSEFGLGGADSKVQGMGKPSIGLRALFVELPDYCQLANLLMQV